MFTGIVEACVSVIDVGKKPGLTSFAIKVQPSFQRGLKLGASVAVDGMCLTLVQSKRGVLIFDAMAETLHKTTIGELRPGKKVNLERSATMSTEIGGHILSGHVTGTATIVKIAKPKNNHIVTFRVEKTWMKYILPKGFIALDGVSLTVVDVSPAQGTFTVYFIPETLQRTTFGFKKERDHVNLEIDSRTQAIVDTVERYFKKYGAVLE